MNISFIILTASGERLDLNEANEFNPNEYAWSNPNDPNEYVALLWDAKNLEGYCYKLHPEDDPNDPTRAVTIGFKAYDSEGNEICQDAGGGLFWL